MQGKLQNEFPEIVEEAWMENPHWRVVADGENYEASSSTFCSVEVLIHACFQTVLEFHPFYDLSKEFTVV